MPDTMKNTITRPTTGSCRAKQRLRPALLMAIPLAMGLGTPAQSAERTYVGRVGGGWDNARAWSPFGIPAEGDVALLDRDHRLDLSSDTASLSELKLTNDAWLFTRGSRLTVENGRGIVDVSGSSILEIDANATQRSSNSLEARELILSDSTLQLFGGNVRLDSGGDDATGGGQLTNSAGLIAGHGVITIEGASTVLANRAGSIGALGGDLRLRSTTGTFAFDNQSNLYAEDGRSTLFIQAPLNDAYEGNIRVRGGNEVNFSEPFTLGPAGTIQMDANNGTARIFTPEFENRGGTINFFDGIVSAGRFDQQPGSTLSVRGSNRSQVISSFIDISGSSTIDGDLTLDGNTMVRDDAVISGAGSLTFERGHTYRARSDAGMTFDVPVFNRGVLSPGITDFADDGVAMIDFESLSLGTSSVLELTIAGTELTDFDRIVSDELSISGVLDVTVDDDFTPSVGDRFHIMDANAMRGTFERLHTNMAAGQLRLVYEESDVFLEVFPPIIIGLTRGDFNDDRVLNAIDIDMLNDAIRLFENGDETPESLLLDLTSDGILDAEDREVWVEDLKATFFGDSNLDGEFNSGDLVSVFQRGQYEDAIVGNSGWSDGDWNGDGEFDSADFVLAFQSAAYESGPRAAVSVPEPTALALAWIGLVGLFSRKSRSSARQATGT